MLIDDLKRVQADTFAFYAQAHFFHWNVEGPNFNDYHAFLGEIYNDAWTAVDTIAEFVRQLDEYAPGAGRMLSELTRIKQDDGIPEALEMFRRLEANNEIVMEGLVTCYMSAEAAGEIGLTNFLQDRMAVHKKHRWMIKSILK